MVQTNKQVESCFLNHNSSIHFCCTDSFLVTHRGGLSLSNKNRFIRILRFQSYRPFKICGDFCLSFSFSFNSELGFLLDQFS